MSRGHHPSLAMRGPRDVTSTWPRVVDVNHESLRRRPLSTSDAFLLCWPRLSCVAWLQANSLAITMPVNPLSPAERSARAYALYPAIAMANHSCLPTVTRWDEMEGESTKCASAFGDDARRIRSGVAVGALLDAVNAMAEKQEQAAMATEAPVAAAATTATAAFEAPSCAAPAVSSDAARAALRRPPLSLATRLVALHSLPAGSEVVLSYTPLGVPEADRRLRLSEEYGFECDCARCRLERAEAGAVVGERGGGRQGGGE
eukprot:6201796-Pleurochrysis_carterae.AAC.1